MPEIKLSDNCPGCYQESGIDNPLMMQPGAFVGIYCTRPNSSDKGHIYDDTAVMREELNKVRALRRQRGAPEKPPEPVVPKAAEVKPDAEPAPVANIYKENMEPEAVLVSAKELKAFEVAETDIVRLQELLGQEIGDSGTLVGAVYSMTLGAKSAVDRERQQAAAMEEGSRQISQAGDGSLRLKVFLPWPVGRAMVERAVFNNVSLQDVVQNAMEFIMASGSFPWDVRSEGLIDLPYDGFWMVIMVPELYVGSVLDRAAMRGMSATQYVQAFIYDSIEQEQLA